MASGRKKAFDETEALSAAMETFWAKGYVGASLTDLTSNMGINKPSMYSTFGNKEALFIKAVQHYIDTVAKKHMALLEAKDVPFGHRVRNYLLSIVASQCDTGVPRGCFLALCQSEVAGGEIPEEACALLHQASNASQAVLTELFNSDVQAKALGLHQQAFHNALCLNTVLKGTASMARDGVAYADLEQVVESSLKGIAINAFAG